MLLPFGQVKLLQPKFGCKALNNSAAARQPHAETLLPALRIALNELGWSLASIDAIVFDARSWHVHRLAGFCSIGPGLAVALNKPVIPVCSLVESLLKPRTRRWVQRPY